MYLNVEKLVRDMKATALPVVWVSMARAGKMLGLRDLWAPGLPSGPLALGTFGNN